MNLTCLFGAIVRPLWMVDVKCPPLNMKEKLIMATQWYFLSVVKDIQTIPSTCLT